MCFSASASIGATVLLAGAGCLALKRSYSQDKKYIPIACIPLFFAVQQLFEAIVWLSLPDLPRLNFAALGFLFFSHFFWLLWIPLVCFYLEPPSARKLLFLALTITGLIFGLSLYLPIALGSSSMAVEVLNHAIVYNVKLLYDEWIARKWVWLLYILIIATPLLFSSIPKLRMFGWLVLGAAALERLLFGYALISIWCYFSAIASLYLVFVIFKPLKSRRL